MPRIAGKHSNNWGGARPNSGPKKGSVQRMTQKAIEMAESAEIHPMQFLLNLMADQEQPMKLRADAAQACMPYCLSRLSSAEINVNKDTDTLSNDQILIELKAGYAEIFRLMPEAKFINGSARQIESRPVDSDAEVVG